MLHYYIDYFVRFYGSGFGGLTFLGGLGFALGSSSALQEGFMKDLDMLDAPAAGTESNAHRQAQRPAAA